NDGKSDRAENQPQRHRPDLCRRKMLTFEINVSSEIDKASDHPTERDANRTANQTHGARFGEEEAAHVSVTGTHGLHDSDFAPAFEDGHHQRIHDADGSNGQSQTTEDGEEHVEHRKELAHTAGGIDDGKSAESHFLNGIFDDRDLIGIPYPHAK